MNNYKIQVINPCQEFLDDLKEYNVPIHNQLCDTIREVIANPFKSKFKRLENSDRDRRARSGDFRIVYFVKHDVIFITKIGLRKNVYKMDIDALNSAKRNCEVYNLFFLFNLFFIYFLNLKYSYTLQYYDDILLKSII